jgi:glycosyltransferase involved in cell wall biosynthesis
MIYPEISIVLGSYNRRAFLKATIESVRRNGITVQYEIIVIDGGSTDGSVRWLTKQKDVITIVQHNRGEFRGQPIDRKSWGYFMNIAFKAAHGKYILMISDDCLIVPGSVMNGYNHFEDLLKQGRKIGAMAFYWRNWPDEEKYRVGTAFGKYVYVNHGLYLKATLEEVGWIDEINYRFYHADSDLCLRLHELGHETVDCPDAFVEHFTHANILGRLRNSKSQSNDYQHYQQRWSHLMKSSTIDHASEFRWLTRHDASNTYRAFPKTAYIQYLVIRHAKNLYKAFRRYREK